MNRMWRSVGYWADINEAWSVPVDVIQKNDEIIVKASLPGVKPEQIEVAVEDNVLTLKAESQEEKESEKSGYMVRERSWGSFYRALRLPAGTHFSSAVEFFLFEVPKVLLLLTLVVFGVNALLRHRPIPLGANLIAGAIILALVLALATLTFPARASRWRIILAARSPGVRWKPVWHATAIGFMANNLLPARTGELARGYAASRLVGLPFAASIGSIAVERVFDGLIVVLLMAVAISSADFLDRDAHQQTHDGEARDVLPEDRRDANRRACAEVPA
jgi:hypothetical protein